MATKSEKRERVERITQAFAAAPLWMVSDYRGLKVKRLEELRRAMRGTGASIQVTKNTLARRAAEAAHGPEVATLFKGPSAVTLCGDDVVGPAKALWQLSQRDERWAVRGGVLQGRLIGAEAVKRLATLPGRQELIARVVSGVASPLTGLVWTLESVLSGVVYALQGRLEQLRSSAE